MSTCQACLSSGMSEEGECFWCGSTQEALNYLLSRGLDPAEIYYFMGRRNKAFNIRMNDAVKIAECYKNRDDKPN